jgi:hypothetical protein
MYQEYEIVTGETCTAFYHVLFIHMLHRIFQFTIQRDNGLNMAQTRSCVFLKSKHQLR